MTFLRDLATTINSRKRNSILRKANAQDLNVIRNICHNTCCGKYKLPLAVRRKLHRYRHHIRDLSNKSKLKTIDGVRRRLIQHGGFLPALLPAVLSLLSPLIAKAV